MLQTTTVGSFPKPAYLVKARNEFASGKISEEKLSQLEKKATEECIRLQERVGLDILVHGEMERGDMVTYFAERMKGFGISGLVRSYGNRFYRKPVVRGEVKREKPITVKTFQYAQSLTEKPVKGMLTGSYTMCDWSFNEYYPDRRELVLALAKEIHKEVVDLEKAGAEYIQIDEPAISTRPDEIELAIEAMKIVTDGIGAKTISHICYGDFRIMYPRILDLAVDQLDLEFANSDFSNLEIFKHPKFTKEIAVGVLDVHSHIIEKKDEVKENIRKALRAFPVQKVYIDPDCGLKTRTPEEAEEKLKVMVEAVIEIKEELGIE
ncbi:MAG: methionine synthase [candidate division Zixibacteria bacterium SM23_73_3]|nr:MAG: methionine synthase [candidate division Zixibacteria bacterium SM23_73_3]